VSLKTPLDTHPYARDPRSRPADGSEPDALYAYVRDAQGIVLVVPDGPHVHPRILGMASPAMYAGDMTILGGQVQDLTNLSGTFQCDDPAGLVEVADQLLRQGLTIVPQAVRFFPADGTPPQILR